MATRFFEPGNHSTNEGWPEIDLAILYNAADLVVSTSWGEGFGLTLAEAAACGTPIVAQNVSSITEVVGPGGLLLEPLTTTTVTSGEDQWLPDVPAFTEAIEHLYADPALRASLGDAGLQHASNFRWGDAAEAFDRIIRELAATVQNGDKDARQRQVPDLQRPPQRRNKVKRRR